MRIFFGDPFEAAHDGIDPKILLSLKGDEKEQAQKLLLDAIENSEDDWRLFEGIGYLKLKQASKTLKRRLAKDFKSANTKIWVAWALWKIEEYPESLKVIIDILNDKNQGEYTRTNAVVALRDFGKRKDVISTLINAFSDEKDDSLVGRYAFEAVGHLFSSDPNVRELLSRILEARWEDRYKFRASEIKMLKDLLRRKMKRGFQ